MKVTNRSVIVDIGTGELSLSHTHVLAPGVSTSYFRDFKLNETASGQSDTKITDPRTKIAEILVPNATSYPYTYTDEIKANKIHEALQINAINEFSLLDLESQTFPSILLDPATKKEIVKPSQGSDIQELRKYALAVCSYNPQRYLELYRKKLKDLTLEAFLQRLYFDINSVLSKYKDELKIDDILRELLELRAGSGNESGIRDLDDSGEIKQSLLIVKNILRLNKQYPGAIDLITCPDLFRRINQSNDSSDDNNSLYSEIKDLYETSPEGFRLAVASLNEMCFYKSVEIRCKKHEGRWPNLLSEALDEIIRRFDESPREQIRRKGSHTEQLVGHSINKILTDFDKAFNLEVECIKSLANNDSRLSFNPNSAKSVVEARKMVAERPTPPQPAQRPVTKPADTTTASSQTPAPRTLAQRTPSPPSPAQSPAARTPAPATQFDFANIDTTGSTPIPTKAGRTRRSWLWLAGGGTVVLSIAAAIFGARHLTGNGDGGKGEINGPDHVSKVERDPGELAKEKEQLINEIIKINAEEKKYLASSKPALDKTNKDLCEKYKLPVTVWNQTDEGIMKTVLEKLNNQDLLEICKAKLTLMADNYADPVKLTEQVKAQVHSEMKEIDERYGLKDIWTTSDEKERINKTFEAISQMKSKGYTEKLVNYISEKYLKVPMVYFFRTPSESFFKSSVKDLLESIDNAPVPKQEEKIAIKDLCQKYLNEAIDKDNFIDSVIKIYPYNNGKIYKGGIISEIFLKEIKTNKIPDHVLKGFPRDIYDKNLLLPDILRDTVSEKEWYLGENENIQVSWIFMGLPLCNTGGITQYLLTTELKRDELRVHRMAIDKVLSVIKDKINNKLDISKANSLNLKREITKSVSIEKVNSILEDLLERKKLYVASYRCIIRFDEILTLLQKTESEIKE